MLEVIYTYFCQINVVLIINYCKHTFPKYLISDILLIVMYNFISVYIFVLGIYLK